MPCDLLNAPLDCKPSDLVDDVIGGVAASAWESVCKSFADAAVAMLKGFAVAFAAFPNVDLTSDGVRSVYGLSLGIAGFVAALLLLIQIGRTVITHDGNALAQGFIGIGKAALAFMITLTMASTALVAADALTVFIINRTFGNVQGLTTKLTTLFEFGATNSPALLLLLAVIGIVLVAVLWFELLLRNAAVVVLIATSPIAAVGMVSDATKQWWSQTVSATVRLIILKPVIALVFALGFGVVGNESKDIGALLAGMLILLLAVLAWPAIGRFFTFAAAHTGGPSGLGAVLGFGAGRAADAAGGGPATGVEPDQFGQHAEARTMASFASKSGSAASAGGGGAAAGGAAAGGTGAGAAGAAGGAAGGATVAAGAAGAGIPLLVAKGAEMAQRAVNSVVGRMEQTAGHAGLSGASPYASPAGYARPVPSMNSTGPSMSSASPARPGGAVGGGQPEEPSSAPPGSTSRAPAAEPLLSHTPPVEPMSSAGPPAEHNAAPPLSEPGAPPAPGPEPGPAGPISSPAADAAHTPAPAPPPPPAAGPAPQQIDTAPPVPQQRAASPVEQARPEPARPGQVGPIEHLRPSQSSPVEHQKGDKS